MNKYIEIVEDQDKEVIERRFRNKIRYYKSTGTLFVIFDAVMSVLMIIAYVMKQTNPMNIGIFMAVIAAVTIPFIMSSFNKVWQLGSDIESGRVQAVIGRVEKIRKEVKRKRKYNLLIMERKEMLVDEDYCGEFVQNDRIKILQGISSKIPISAFKTDE